MGHFMYFCCIVKFTRNYYIVICITLSNIRNFLVRHNSGLYNLNFTIKYTRKAYTVGYYKSPFLFAIIVEFFLLQLYVSTVMYTVGIRQLALRDSVD
jgi:hypothetical protein